MICDRRLFFRALPFLKWLLPAVVLGGLLADPALAASPGLSARFNSANKLYERGQYADAAAAYEKLIHSGKVSAALYFNLGNAFYKAGEIGRAIAAYHQAQLLSPRDPDLRANLHFVREQIEGPTLTPNRWQRWLNRLSLNEWTVIAATVLWVWLLSLALMQFRPSWRRSLRNVALFGGIATGALGLCLAAAFLTNSSPTAVVITKDAVVHNGPLEESQKAFVVHDGAELNVVDHRKDWLQVSVGNRRIGWVKRDEVQVLPRPT